MWLSRKILRWMGWKVEGQLPNEKKLIIAGVPHTSNWDFVLTMLAKMALGLHFSYLMKKEAFIWPFRRWFISLGGVPIDRKQSKDVVDQLVAFFNSQDKAWLAITPEGTRSKVDKWKTGFLRMAEKSQAPIFIVAWDYSLKTVILEKIWETTGDHASDAEAIRQFSLKRYHGRNKNNQ